MKTALFDFDLPPERIATTPANPRDAARMLVVGEAALEDRLIRDLPGYLHPGDLLVFNNTRVIPARLFTEKNGRQIEILLHKPRRPKEWQVFARPAKRLKIGDELCFHPTSSFPPPTSSFPQKRESQAASPDLDSRPSYAEIGGNDKEKDGDDKNGGKDNENTNTLKAHILEKLPSGEVILAFNKEGDAFWQALEHCGHVPLPPYIARADTTEDKARYQTVYAQHNGSVAAPTAGLHFTEDLLARLTEQGVRHAFVTLHVGAGTFQPVKVEDTEDHVMHREYAMISKETADAVNETKARGGRVIAVGTTSLRSLESAADASGVLHPYQEETGIFITPGYRFKLVDALLTNFHLPRSTLFMLVCAFTGTERMKQAYAHAIREEYRFYSYGDGCLLKATGKTFDFRG